MTDPTLIRDRSAETAVPVAREGHPAGSQVGRYVLLERIASGGMGEVFAAWDPHLDRKVALKLVRPDVVAEYGSSQGRSRLLREAQAMAKLSHPNIVTVHDVGTVNDEIFVAMEFLEGESLREFWMEKKRSWRELVRVFIDAGKGLAAAHQKGLIHRDFKPHNVIVTKEGRVCVLDFGLARAANAQVERENTVDEERTVSGPMRTLAVDSTLTEAGSVMGTPGYMSPEQYKGEPTDARTDQYSFCISLYEALYGDRPYRGSSLDELKEKALKGVGPNPPDRRVPSHIYALLRRGLSPKKEDRFASMDELLKALQRTILWSRSTRSYVALAIGLVAIAVVATAATQRAISNPCPSAAPKWQAVWDDPQRQTVANVFALSKLPFADGAAKEVDRALTEYGNAWIAMKQDACEASYVRHEQSGALFDKRMQCLDGRLSDARRLANLFQHADATVVTKATEATGTLRSIASCGDVRYLKAMAAEPPSSIVDAVHELSARIAEARTRAAAGKDDEAKSELDDAAKQVQALDWAPLTAQLELALSNVALDKGQYVASAERAQAAAVSALSANDSEQLTNAWIALIKIRGRDGDLSEALRYADYARVELARSGNSQALEADLEYAVAGIYLNAAEYQKALDHQINAVALYEKAYGGHSEQAALAWAQKGWIESWLGDQKAALGSMKHAHFIAKARFSEGHPTVAHILMQLAAVEEEDGDLEDALTHHQQALHDMIGLYGDSGPGLATEYNDLALLYIDLQKTDDAVKAAEKGLQLTLSLDEHSTTVGSCYDTLGQSLVAAHRPKEAISAFNEALARNHLQLGDDNLEAAYAKTGLGESYVQLGDWKAALTYLEPALKMREAKETLPSEIGRTRAAYARALLLKGDKKGALEMAAKARESFKQAGRKAAWRLAALDQMF